MSSFISWCWFICGAPWRTTDKCRCGVIVIHTWAHKRWGSHDDALYKSTFTFFTLSRALHESGMGESQTRNITSCTFPMSMAPHRQSIRHCWSRCPSCQTPSKYSDGNSHSNNVDQWAEETDTRHLMQQDAALCWPAYLQRLALACELPKTATVLLFYQPGSDIHRTAL